MDSFASPEEILAGVRAGDSSALSALYESEFGRLRSIGAAKLRRESYTFTIQPTVLVTEAFLRLRGAERLSSSIRHFRALVGRAMDQILIDRYRTRKMVRRVLPEHVASLLSRRDPSQSELYLTLNAELLRLRRCDRSAADAIHLYYFEERTLENVSRELGCTIHEVRVRLAHGVSWLARRLSRRG
jgi:DNA-directed RNA polymerase specialized sigma24 family protein